MLQCIAALIFDFMTKFREPEKGVSHFESPSARELDEVRGATVIMMQDKKLEIELTDVRRFVEVNKGNPFINSSPLLNEQNLLKVGGRLQASDLPEDAKDSIILPHDYTLTKLIMDNIHRRYHHISPQLLL